MRQQRRIPTPPRPRRPGSGSGPRARRRAIEASEPGRSDFDEGAHIAAMLLAQAGNVDTALQVEWLVSRFLPCWGDGPTLFDADYIESTALAVVAELEGTGDAVALTVLLGLEAVAGGAIAEAAGAAAQRLTGQGAPPWAWQIGHARAVEARMSGNDEDASLGVIVEYAYPDGSGHAVAAFVADDMGGAVKFLGLMKPFAEACGTDEMPFETVDPVEGERMIRAALEVTDQEHARFDGDPSVPDLGPLAWSRVRG